MKCLAAQSLEGRGRCRDAPIDSVKYKKKKKKRWERTNEKDEEKIK